MRNWKYAEVFKEPCRRFDRGWKKWRQIQADNARRRRIVRKMERRATPCV